MNPLYFIIGVPVGFSVAVTLLLFGAHYAGRYAGRRRGRHRADDLEALIDATREQRVSPWDGVSDEVLVLMHESACAEIAVRMIAEHGQDAIEAHLREAS